MRAKCYVTMCTRWLQTKDSHSKTSGYSKVQWENLRGQTADLLVNKIVPLESGVSAAQDETLGE